MILHGKKLVLKDILSSEFLWLYCKVSTFKFLGRNIVKKVKILNSFHYIHYLSILLIINICSFISHLQRSWKAITFKKVAFFNFNYPLSVLLSCYLIVVVFTNYVYDKILLSYIKRSTYNKFTHTIICQRTNVWYRCTWWADRHSGKTSSE